MLLSLSIAAHALLTEAFLYTIVVLPGTLHLFIRVNCEAADAAKVSLELPELLACEHLQHHQVPSARQTEHRVER